MGHIKNLIRLAILVSLTSILGTATPAHIKNFPPQHKVFAAKEKVPTEKPAPIVEAVAQTETVPAQAVEPTPPVAIPVTGCGSDPNMVYIYQHESGCSTAAINVHSGACGIGQALPCSKLPCTLSDWDCQNNWFTAYAIARYGSTYAAYVFWVNNHWW